MTQPRSKVIDLDYTPYYHCISRCVRRAFLCGQDHYSGQSFEHRRQWILDLLAQLTEVFCIDICAYALMSNHYHLVLRVDRKRCLQLSDFEVARRWLVFYKGCTLTKRFLEGGSLLDADKKTLKQLIEKWRHRLYNLSWFMKILNERIARRANQEDQCKGKFWECRFKSQALLDETALLSCMAYVDLNPIRAGISQCLEESEFTSIQARLHACSKNLPKAKATKGQSSRRSGQFSKDRQPSVVNSSTNSIKQAVKQVFSDTTDRNPEMVRLLPFRSPGAPTNDAASSAALPFFETDYFQWVEYLGKTSLQNKPGKIPASVRSLFDKYQLHDSCFLQTLSRLETRFPVRMGQHTTLVHYARQAGLHWCHGFRCSRELCRAA